MIVNPGELNKKIQIISLEKVKDNDGFSSETEKIIVSTFAKVTNTSGTTIIKSNANFEDANTRFLLRTPKEEIKTNYKVKYKNYIYSIDYINNYNEDDKYTEIYGKRTDLNG